ncbi:hypothetical protein pdam_00022706 [Pocillopora damicornis]|uniref:RING-type E3 ubiquitin transferase n=1 Tax=Pocillopora damicornis TaxID=46731 RepID=A0A3M6T9Y2_POCDA|nr:hypothetical protein pdam_00022706 [Pocillopora damicornis]
MASGPANDDLEVVEIVTYDRNDRENENVVESEDESDREEQEMEVDAGENEQENERVQQSSEENNMPDVSEVQSSIQNVTPAVARNVQVLGLSEVNSPDEFQKKSSKTTTKNISATAKNTRLPVKSPEKDDDVSFSHPKVVQFVLSLGQTQVLTGYHLSLVGISLEEAIKAIDTTERDRALADLEKEKEARQKAEEREARALLQYQLAKAECERIVEQLKRQEQLVVSLQRERSSSCSQCSSESQGASTAVRTFGQSTSSQRLLSRKSYVLQTSFQVSQNGARVISFDQHHAVLVVSKPSPNQLFPGFGVVKVSSLDSKHCEFVRIHQKAVRDVAFNNRGDGLLLTASMDKTVRVTSMLSNAVVQTPGGILVCKLEGAFFWEKTPGADFVPHCLTLPEGSCTSLSFEPSTRHCLFSLRPSKKFPQTRHLVCQLQGKGVGVSMARAQAERAGNMEDGDDDASLCTCQAVNQCVGGPTQKLLSKSRLFTCPDDCNTLMVAADFDMEWQNGNQLQKLPNQGKETLDVLPFGVNGNDYLATIDEQKLSVYKWMNKKIY